MNIFELEKRIDELIYRPFKDKEEKGIRQTVEALKPFTTYFDNWSKEDEWYCYQRILTKLGVN